MIFCTECGTKHENDAFFCENCGAKLKKPVFTENSTKEVKKPVKLVKKSKFKLLKFIALLLMVTLFFVFLRHLFLGFNDPGVKLMHGTVKALQEEKPEFTLELSIEDGNSEYDFLEDMTLEVAGSMRGEDLAGIATMKYNKKDLAEGVIAYQEGHVFIDLKDLYDDVMFLDASDVKITIKELVGMKAYLQDLDIKGVKWKTYGKIFTDEMNTNIDKDGSDVLLTMDVKDLSSAFEKILDEAEKDKDLKKGLKKALEKMLKDMIKDDFEFFGSDKDDFKEMLDEMDDYWDDAYEALIDQARSILEYDDDYWYGPNISSLEGSLFDGQTLRFSFSQYKLTAIEASLDINGIEVEAALSLKDGYKAKNYKVKKSEDLEDYTEKDMTKMISEVAGNVLDNVEKNKSLVKNIEKSSIFQMLSYSLGVDDMEGMFDFIEDNGIEELIYRFMFY